MELVNKLLQFPVKLVFNNDLDSDAQGALSKIGEVLKKIIPESLYDSIVSAIKKASGEELDLDVNASVNQQGGASSQNESGGTGAGENKGGGEQQGGTGRKVNEKGGNEGGPTSTTDHLKGEKEKREEDKAVKQIAMVRSAVHTSTNLVGNSLKKGFGIVEDIYGRLKSASPLLQAIESMFNLAMQLFFMPLGNKLADVMIPSVLQLVDDVIRIWDSFEGKTLSEMFDFAISQAGRIFGGYFSNIGDALINQGGDISSIGKLLKSIGGFIENNGAKVIETILNVVSTIISNFKHFISLWFTLKMTEIAMGAAGFFGDAGANGVIAAVGVGAAAGLISEIGLTAAGFSEGGYIPETPGGRIVRVSEGGEGEYIVPESKVQTFIESHGGSNLTNILNKMDDSKTHNNLTTIGGDVLNSRHDPSYKTTTINNMETTKQSQTFNITFNINGYTDSELQSIIRTTVDEQVAKATYRS